jgi:hypothetical protein
VEGPSVLIGVVLLRAVCMYDKLDWQFGFLLGGCYIPAEMLCKVVIGSYCI